MKNNSLLNSANMEKVNYLIEDTEKNVQEFNNICSKILKQYSESLDNFMADLYVECIKTENAPTEVLEKYFLELSNLLYFMQEKLEQSSIFSDMSESAAKEIYSKTDLDNQVKEVTTGKNKTTVAELAAKAELGAQYESVVANIYEHVYQALKNKINSAQDMLSTIRKILSGRQTEMNFSTYTRRGEE